MSFNTGVSYLPTDFITASMFNGVGNDLRAWGGNVNAGGFNLTNVGSLFVNGAAVIGTSTTGTVFFSTAVSAPALSFGVTTGAFTFWDTGGTYLTILPGTGVGVLNASPATALDVSGAITLRPTTTPANPSASSEARTYIKSGKRIYQYNDAGTTRWKYLDLTGTGVTWVHTTTAP